MGRTKLPTKIKQIRGTVRADRVPAKEPESDVQTLPMPPDDMDDNAKAMWLTTCGKLLSLGMLSSVGLPQIRRYSQNYSIYMQAQTALKAGKIVGKSGGITRINPWWKVSQEAEKMMLAFEDRWGLSPSTQGKINWPNAENDKADEADEFDL